MNVGVFLAYNICYSFYHHKLTFCIIFRSSWKLSYVSDVSNDINLHETSTIHNEVHSTHYSKSQIFVQNSILTKPQHFHEFFIQFFFGQFFSWNQSCQQLKSPKPQHFHEFFTQKIDNFHGKSKLNFWTKNEYFEQCDAY